MTNYNDGQWHGWNGGECPVHPESIIEVVTGGGGVIKMAANYGAWDDPTMQLIAFRVIKEHKGPRDFWISELSGDVYKTKAPLCIHVREVME